MLDAIESFFGAGSFIPHGHCYLWKPFLVSLHVLSDGLIAIAYYSIPLVLVSFARQRQDLPFRRIFLLFGAFIVACGTTHLLEIWTLWHPAYWLSGTIKAVTALISVLTALRTDTTIAESALLTKPQPAKGGKPGIRTRNG